MITVDYYLNADDDTYIYGDLMFQCEYDERTNTYIQPFIRKDGDKIIKFYDDKHLFVVYENAEIVEITMTMSCWSDDYIVYKIKDRKAYKYHENYHGRPSKIDEPCDIDFSEFIRDNGL